MSISRRSFLQGWASAALPARWALFRPGAGAQPDCQH